MAKAYTGVDVEGWTFFITRRDHAEVRDPNYIEVEVPSTLKDLLPFLEELANRSMLKVKVEVEEPVPFVAAVEPLPVRLEDIFENLPLATQLHYAALAVENARDRIKEIKNA